MEGEEAVTLARAIAWSNGKTIDDEKMKGIVEFKEYSRTVFFTDGSWLRVESEYEEDFSEITPGAGLESPSIWIGKGGA